MPVLIESMFPFGLLILKILITEYIITITSFVTTNHRFYNFLLTTRLVMIRLLLSTFD